MCPIPFFNARRRRLHVRAAVNKRRKVSYSALLYHVILREKVIQPYSWYTGETSK